MIAVTFDPTPPLIVVVPLPAPIFVTVPALLIDEAEKVIVPVVAFSLIVKLLAPVTPPLKVVEMAEPVLPIVSVPTLALVASTIGLAKVRPVVPTSNVAELLPVVLPKVTVPVPEPPSALAEVIAVTVPAWMVRPPVNVLAPPRTSVPARRGQAAAGGILPIALEMVRVLRGDGQRGAAAAKLIRAAQGQGVAAVESVVIIPQKIDRRGHADAGRIRVEGNTAAVEI